MHRLIVTGPAKRDIECAYLWWAEHRSQEQADRWYREIHLAIQSLRNEPEAWPLALDADLLPQGIRQYLFGIGRRPTHRIYFTIDSDDVVILRVRHASQASLSPDELW